jgi:hypothetical protein
MRSRPGFPTRRASALICMAALIANVIKASSPRAAHKGRTYGRTAPVWGQQRKRVPLTAGSFHIWESQESDSRRVGINKILDRPASRSNHAGRSTSGKATAAFGQPLDFPTWADHAVVVTTPTLPGVRTPRALSAAATGRGQHAAPAPAKPSKMKQSRDGENMFERPYADWHIDS